MMLLLSLGTAFAACQDSTVGARAKAMGGGNTAFEDDPTSVWLNPAGIATQSKGLSVSTQTYPAYHRDAAISPTHPSDNCSDKLSAMAPKTAAPPRFPA